MSKELPVTEDELAQMMNDLEAMLAEADAAEAKVEAAPAGPVEPVPAAAIEVPVVEASVPATPAIPPSVIVPTPAVENDKPEIFVPSVDPTPIPVTVPSITPAVEENDPHVYVGPATVAKSGLQHFIDVPTFQAEIAISEHTLDTALIQQSSMRAYYGAQSAYAEGQAARIKAKFEIAEARLYNEYRTKLAVGGNKVTEKMIENAVITDPRWIAAKNLVIDAQTIAEVNKGLTFAMADRRDMLIQLCSDRRKDMEGQVRITAAKDTLTSRAANAVAAARQ